MADSEITCKYIAPPTLWEFQQSDEFFRCVVGPVGSGKSSVCNMEIPARAGRQAPGSDGVRRTRFAIIRNTYGQLRDTTRKTFEQWIPQVAGYWHEQTFTFHMRLRGVESEILFRALDRPGDIGKLLSLELTGAYINEIREVPQEVVEILQTRLGRYPAIKDGGATWSGMWADSNPWDEGHYLSELFAQDLEGHRLFRQPGGRAANAENIRNLPPGYYSRIMRGKSQDWIDVYVDGKDAKANAGSILGSRIASLSAAGLVGKNFEHPDDGCFTSWDLGLSDATAIWVWRIGKAGMVDVIDYYEESGEDISHYARWIKSKPYKYLKHWLPHDARAKNLQTGKSTVERLAEEGIPYEAIGITPSLHVDESIDAARWILEGRCRIHERCTKELPPRKSGLRISGLKVLRGYAYAWDETKKVFSKHPDHNWASHGADAFRYMATAVRVSEAIAEPPKDSTAKVSRPVTAVDTLDRLWEEEQRKRSVIERI